MRSRTYKYLHSFSVPFVVGFSFFQDGWLSFFPIIYGFGFIPLLELLLKTDAKNLSEMEREVARKDKFYDWLLYLTVPIQYAFLIWFVWLINAETFGSIEFWGRIASFGLLCGVIGINVAHELGHRTKSYERVLAKLLLFTSLYAHFFVEHNFGHHKNVATDDDPASAKYNESLYAFWLRSIFFSYLSAWHIENTRVKRAKANPVFGNEMVRFTLIQLGLIVAVGFYAGWVGAMAFVIAAFIGGLLLETVNYIEHYGLRRQKISDKRYEDVAPRHSWNSNHIVGRILLFELTRHSDHHAFPNKKYQLLDNHDENPQLPAGYPGMMLLATVPPLWFWVMNPRIQKLTNG